MVINSEEEGKLTVPEEVDGTCFAVAVFGYHQLRGIGFLCLRVIIPLPIDKHDYIGILLYRTRFAQVGKHGVFVLTGLHASG
jgi:hypothetical protein